MSIVKLKNDKKDFCDLGYNFKVFFDNAADGMLLANVKTKKFLIGNRAICRMLGYSRSELKQMKISDIYSQPHLLNAISTFNQAVKKNNLLAESIPVLKKNRHIFYADINTSAVTLGREKFLLGVFRDVTKRQSAEEEAFKSKRMLELVLDNIPQRVFWKDLNSVYLGANKALIKDAGFKKLSQLVGKDDYQAAWSATADIYRADDKAVIKTGRAKINYEEPQIKSDGNQSWLRTSKVPLRDKVGRIFGIMGTYEDITDQKRAAQIVKETATKDEALLSSIADGVIAVNKDGEIILINHAATRMLGWTKKEALGKKWFEILRKEDEEGFPVSLEKSEFRAALSGVTTTETKIPFFYVKKNGVRFPVERAVSPVELGRKVIGAIDVFRDITHEKELDRAKNDFLSLVSHQLRTPLSAAKWILEMLAQSPGLDDKQQSYLRDLHVSNERLISLVNGLLNVAMIESGKLSVNKKMVNIISLINNSFKLCQHNAEKRNQQVRLLMETEVKETRLDAMLFSEALDNILNNAISYGLEKSVITIKVSLDNSNYVVAVHDNGPAIPKADRLKIFGKFYRGESAQKAKYMGSGLGLFISKAAVEANGGSIWFKSSIKDGTTFYFTVPHK